MGTEKPPRIGRHELIIRNGFEQKRCQWIFSGLHVKALTFKAKVDTFIDWINFVETEHARLVNDKQAIPKYSRKELDTIQLLIEHITGSNGSYPITDDKSAEEQIIRETQKESMKHLSQEDYALSERLCSESVKKSREAIDNELKLAEAAVDAKKAMEFAVSVWKKDAVDFMTASDDLLKQFRQTRMAMDMEVSKIKASTHDILSILGDPGFSDKMAAVQQLITAAERLKALKESGFLDALVDTLLKANELASK